MIRPTSTHITVIPVKPDGPRAASKHSLKQGTTKLGRGQRLPGVEEPKRLSSRREDAKHRPMDQANDTQSCLFWKLSPSPPCSMPWTFAAFCPAKSSTLSLSWLLSGGNTQIFPRLVCRLCAHSHQSPKACRPPPVTRRAISGSRLRCRRNFGPHAAIHWN